MSAKGHTQKIFLNSLRKPIMPHNALSYRMKTQKELEVSAALFAKTVLERERERDRERGERERERERERHRTHRVFVT